MSSIDSHIGSIGIGFLTVSLLFGAFIRVALKKIPLPYTVFLMIFGFLIGSILSSNNKLLNSMPFVNIEPTTLLAIFLPALIFESSFSTDVHIFQKCIGQIIILSVIGYLMAALMHAAFAFFAMEIYNWSFIECLLYGVILSATDPVAVVAILKDLGASKHLSVIIEGESLLNDGTAIVFFNILSETIAKSTIPSDFFANFFYKFFSTVCGGVLFGYIAAKIEIAWLSRIHSDLMSEITLTIAIPYILYVVCEYFKMSGVLGIVVLGFMLNSHKACITDIEFVHKFWELLAYFCNTIIFILVGLLISHHIALETSYLHCEIDFMLLIESYLFANIIRLCVYIIFGYFLSKLGYGFTWKDAVISVWGGLRGAVGLALAISLAVDARFKEKSLFINYVLIHTGSIVMLTLLINASTVSLLLGLLGGNEVLLAKQFSMLLAISHLNKLKRCEIISLKRDRFLADSDWNAVEAQCVIDNPYIRTKKQHLELILLQKAVKTNSKLNNLTEQDHLQDVVYFDLVDDKSSNQTDVEELYEEARFKILHALKANFWVLYYDGQLSHEALYILNDYCDLAQDKPSQFINVIDLIDTCKTRGIYHGLLFKLKIFLRVLVKKSNKYSPLFRFFKSPTHTSVHDTPSFQKTRTKSLRDSILSYSQMRSHFLNDLHNNHKKLSKFKKNLLEFEATIKYNLFMNTCILINMIYITLPLINTFNELMTKYNVNYLTRFNTTFNSIFIFIFLLEFLFKIYLYTPKFYVKSLINLSDLLLLVYNIVLLILETIKILNNRQLSIYLNLLNYLRIIRFIATNTRFYMWLINKLIEWVNIEFNQRIYVGYGVAKGYVLAVEFIIKRIKQYAPLDEVASKIKQILLKDCEFVIKELVQMQSEHPGTAVSVKTKHSLQRIVTVLNKEINEMSVNGIIDDKEADKLLHQINIISHKRISELPNSMAQSNPTPMFQSTIWLAGCNNIIDTVIESTKPCTYAWNQILYTEGSQLTGIYFIAAGIVELFKPVIADTNGGNTASNEFSSKSMSMYLTTPTAFRQTSMSMAAMSSSSGIMNVDRNVSNEKLAHHKHDVYCEGDLIGAYEYLNKCAYEYTCKCITNVTAYHIPNELLDDIFKDYNRNYRLIERLWLAVSLNIAENILIELNNNEKLYKNDLLIIRRVLHNAYIKIDFKSNSSYFYIDLNVVLIQGKVKPKRNKNNHSTSTSNVKQVGDYLIGPCYINRSVMKSGVKLVSNNVEASENKKIVMLILSEKKVNRKVGISLANILNK